MNARRFGDGTFVVVLATGEEVMESLAGMADEHDLSGARVEGIGALRRATLGLYDLARKEYQRFRVEEEVELLSLLGNISRLEGRPRVHLHATVSAGDGTARGGHVFDAVVGATCELFVSPLPGPLDRVLDEEVGLPLIHP